jgi:hypothetical protein
MRARDVSHSAQYLLEHVSESIRRFGLQKNARPAKPDGLPTPLVAGSSQDIECTRVTSPVMSISQKSAIHAHSGWVRVDSLGIGLAGIGPIT